MYSLRSTLLMHAWYHDRARRSAVVTGTRWFRDQHSPQLRACTGRIRQGMAAAPTLWTFGRGAMGALLAQFGPKFGLISPCSPCRWIYMQRLAQIACASRPPSFLPRRVLTSVCTPLGGGELFCGRLGAILHAAPRVRRSDPDGRSLLAGYRQRRYRPEFDDPAAWPHRDTTA